MKLGIGIVTYNRLSSLTECINRVRRFTTMPYQLVVADDGSIDDSAQWCRDNGLAVVTGKNRGVVWNKNRALFALKNYSDCEAIILLEDDCWPASETWAQDWYHASCRWHHINYAHEWMLETPGSLVGGNGSVSTPYRTHLLQGQCSGSSRYALETVGFLDSRFKGYGHGHVEWTRRFLRSGFGGTDSGSQQEFFSIKGGLESKDAPTYRDPDQVKRNEAVFNEVLAFSTYRAPWQNEQEENEFLSELAPLQSQLFQSQLSTSVTHVDTTATQGRIEMLEGRLRNIEELLQRSTKTVAPPAAALPDVNYKQIEALINLHSVLKPNSFLPPLRGWAISPDIANFLYSTVLDQGFKQIIELGGGSSTLIFAYALARLGGGRIVSIDHDPVYCQATQKLINRHGLGEYCQIIHAPLMGYSINGTEYKFYDLSTLGQSEYFDLLFVDGPPGHTGPLARLPALPLLMDKLNNNAIIVLDDANRADERAVVSHWLNAFPELNLLQSPDVEKGALTLARSAESCPDWPRIKLDAQSTEHAKPTHEQLYQIWRSTHKLNDVTLEWVGERFASWPELPRIHLAIILPEDGIQPLSQTLGSLSEQILVEGWKISIIAQEPNPFDFSALPMLDWVETGDRSFLSAVNEALLAGRADWLGMVEAGDRLAPQAFFALADTALRHPEYKVIYSDEDSVDGDGNFGNPYFKPDFSIDLCRSAPYSIGGLMVVNRSLFNALSGFRPEAEGIEYWDLLLRAHELVAAKGIGHHADILYHRFVDGGHCDKPVEELLEVRKNVLRQHLVRSDENAITGDGLIPGTFHIFYKHTQLPLVSIIIPTKDQPRMIKRCVESLLEKTEYSNYEILLVDNGSTDPEAVAFLNSLRFNPKTRVLDYPHPFNFSAMNNLAAREAGGSYLLLLNNDTAVLHEQWLDELVSHALRPSVGVVGCRLLYPDGRVQHAGVILGLTGTPADHVYICQDSEAPGYFGRAQVLQDFSAVTAACMMVRKSLYLELHGLDENQFKVSFNDVDFCLKVRERGLRVVWTPFATLLHEGSVSQKGEVEDKKQDEKLARFREEAEFMFRKWPKQIAFDPAFNRNLCLNDRSVLIEIAPALTWDPEWRPRPRILAHTADRMGCGEYRIISPMRALNAAGKVQGWETASYLNVPELMRMEPDSIVLQRQIIPEQFVFLDKYIRHSKAFRVFEIDDLITNVPIKNPRKPFFVANKDLHKNFRKGIGMCNRLVVSTQYLADEYKDYADEVMVVANYIERALWGSFTPLRRQGKKARVGWAGSVTHHGDLEIVFDVVKETINEVDWVFFGMCPEQLKPMIAEFHPPVKIDDYPAKLASLNLDLAIAPLEDVPFNHGKSHLRLLEYGVLGYPIICTDITPYRGNYPVTRVPNKFRSWVEAIREQVADLDALARQGDQMRDYIQRHWMLEDNLDNWLRAWLP